MSTAVDSVYRSEVVEEIEKIPSEYLPSVLEMVRVFRKSLSLKAASVSFRQGMKEALRGETRPVSELWDGVDVE